jgi:hypothetical protein
MGASHGEMESIDLSHSEQFNSSPSQYRLLETRIVTEAQGWQCRYSVTIFVISTKFCEFFDLSEFCNLIGVCVALR